MQMRSVVQSEAVMLATIAGWRAAMRGTGWSEIRNSRADPVHDRTAPHGPAAIVPCEQT
jgi:hypothetical protein